LEEISLEKSTGDENGDWVFDVEDFYSLVWDYKWTYDALATLSKAVYSPDNSANPNADILDTLGFCLGSSSSLSAAGVLYTTSVGIIEKYQDAETGKWTYAYPTSNQKLVDLANALYKLFENNTSGLATLTVEQATNVGLGDGRSELVAIRGRFAQDKILFGGIIAVGSLEDPVYQQMNEPGKKGFGIVPVPLYTQKYDESGNALSVADGGEEYNTLVHNLARIFAISANTYKFEQCSAFLDYVSTNSADIVDKYCESYLVAADDVIDGSSYNVYMFNYLKNHARDCFDKTYEDMIYKYQLSIDHNASTQRWHTIFSINNYQVSNMAQRYQEIYPEKQVQLETILREWSRLK
ncbi:MAG: hypothetical protein IJW79_07275, partial [Clostridia bacterium]|nr:hypothetical protein [Clostridia bacterium]